MLYYGGWKFKETEGMMRPELTYCVSLGELPYATMAEIANALVINYTNESGDWWNYMYEIFAEVDTDETPDGYLCSPCPEWWNGMPDNYGWFYEMRPSHSLSPRLQTLCLSAMGRFEEAESSGATDEVVNFMRNVVQTASKKRGDPPPPVKNKEGSEETAKKLSSEEVEAGVIKACKYAINNPALSIADLSKLVGVPEKTLEKPKHSRRIKMAKQSGLPARDLTGASQGERVDVRRKVEGSKINKSNPYSADYDGPPLKPKGKRRRGDRGDD